MSPARSIAAGAAPALRRAWRPILATLLAALLAPLAAAQDYPSKPVRIIVPFAAGGPADVYARFIAQRLQESMGQTFIVDDRPGAGSIIGTDAVAKSTPDGYTLLLMSNTHTVNESLIPNKPFQLMRDFVPIAPINSSDLVLVARSGCRSRSDSRSWSTTAPAAARSSAPTSSPRARRTATRCC